MERALRSSLLVSSEESAFCMRTEMCIGCWTFMIWELLSATN